MGRRLQQLGDVGRRLEQVLDVVEHDEDRAVLQAARERASRGLVGLLNDGEHVPDRGHDELGVGDGRESDEEDPGWVSGRDVGGACKREPRLSRAARAG